MRPLDPAIVKRQVENAKIAFPEIFADEDAWYITLESETDFFKLMQKAEQERHRTAGMIAGMELAIADNQRRKERLQNKEKVLRAIEFSMLQAAELQKLELPEATLSIRQGMPKVVIVDEGAIPDEFMRIKREPDKTLIKTALNNFEDVPGATMSNVEPVLAVRVK